MGTMAMGKLRVGGVADRKASDRKDCVLFRCWERECLNSPPKPPLLHVSTCVGAFPEEMGEGGSR